MSCKKWEEMMYVYDDLTDAERSQLDSHIANCKSCEMKLMEVKLQMSVVRQVATERAALRNPGLLTSSIMRAIESRKLSAESGDSFFSKIIRHGFTRYAFAMASMLLLVAFIAEQTTEMQIGPLIKRFPDSKSLAVLNTRSFIKNAINDKSKKDDHRLTSLCECAKDEHCENSIVKNFRRRHKS